MELDELKKSWNALDAQLQKEPIADEKQIKELIANYKTNTRHSLGRLVILQRFSLGTGAVGLAVILLVWFLLPTFGFNEHLQNKIILFLIFITVTILSASRGFGCVSVFFSCPTFRISFSACAIHASALSSLALYRAFLAFSTIRFLRDFHNRIRAIRI